MRTLTTLKPCGMEITGPRQMLWTGTQWVSPYFQRFILDTLLLTRHQEG